MKFFLLRNEMLLQYGSWDPCYRVLFNGLNQSSIINIVNITLHITSIVSIFAILFTKCAVSGNLGILIRSTVTKGLCATFCIFNFSSDLHPIKNHFHCSYNNIHIQKKNGVKMGGGQFVAKVINLVLLLHPS